MLLIGGRFTALKKNGENRWLKEKLYTEKRYENSCCNRLQAIPETW
jgi:hypothetical protein